MSVTYEQPRQDAPSDFQRIYVGSLDYFAKPADVESLLQDAGLDHKKIHISIDPISGRNPGYCFVEFGTHEEAANSLDQLAGKTLLGRTVKLGPCVPKNQGHHNGGARLSEHRQTFQRWGDWKGDGNSRQLRDEQGGQGPYAAMERVETYQPNKDGFRVRVDGLDKMVDQLQNDEEIRRLFEGFEVVAIGKRVIPHSLRGTPGNHHHCFVDLATKEEADRAVAELNGFPFEDGHLKVSLARNNQNHRSHQPRDNRGPRRSDNNQGEQQERRQPPNFERRNQIMEAKSWR